jgi:hypothetical protein
VLKAVQNCSKTAENGMKKGAKRIKKQKTPAKARAF